MSQAGNEKKQASDLEAAPPAADQELGMESLEQVIGGGAEVGGFLSKSKVSPSDPPFATFSDLRDQKRRDTSGQVSSLNGGDVELQFITGNGSAPTGQ